MRFADRIQAGKALAAALADYAGRQDALVMALPRGGVPIAAEVARALDLPLDLLLVRKLGVPGQEELAMGAIALGGLCVLNHQIVGQLHLSQSAFDAVLARERAELDRRDMLYRGNRPLPQIDNRTVIVIDDGLATGATMQAAVAALKKAHAREIVVAVPVGADDSCQEVARHVDRLICLSTPSPFLGVGHWYRDFSQVSDAEVTHLLAQAANDRIARECATAAEGSS